MADHTPTPWTPGMAGWVVGPDGSIVAECYGVMADRLVRERDANAALIVRAVNAHAEILAAAETLLLRCEAADGDVAWASIRAIIAKAKGEPRG